VGVFVDRLKKCSALLSHGFAVLHRWGHLRFGGVVLRVIAGDSGVLSARDLHML